MFEISRHGVSRSSPMLQRVHSPCSDNSTLCICYDTVMSETNSHLECGGPVCPPVVPSDRNLHHRGFHL